MFESLLHFVTPKFLPIRHAAVSPTAKNIIPEKLNDANSLLKNPPSRMMNDNVGARAQPIKSYIWVVITPLSSFSLSCTQYALKYLSKVLIPSDFLVISIIINKTDTLLKAKIISFVIYLESFMMQIPGKNKKNASRWNNFLSNILSSI